MITQLWFIRHGEPEASAKGRCYGTLDVGLSELGLQQATEIAAALRAEQIDAIYSSPRVRCRDTAAALLSDRDVPLLIAEGLREMDFGALEGRAYDDVAAQDPEFYRQWMEHPTEVQFPGGESFGRMWARVTAAGELIRMRHDGSSVAIVTHGGVIRILLAEMLAVAPENIFRFGQRYGAINLIRFYEETPVVELINGVASANLA
jgi:alpha-ribazole phosphatase